MKTFQQIIIGTTILLLVFSSCQKDEANPGIDNMKEAKELIGEINYLVRKNFPSSFSSWQLNNKAFTGGVSGTIIIDGSFSHGFNQGWSTYTSYDRYNNVYISFDNYCDRAEYKLTIDGTFNLNGKISESGTIGGSSSSSGSHILVGIFSVSGKYKEDDLELYLVNKSSTSYNYSAILKTQAGEWQVD